MTTEEQLTALMEIIIDAQEALKACGYDAPPDEPLCESIRNIAAGRRGWRQLYEELSHNHHDALVAALEHRMESCSCHFGGIDPDGFADQPCPDCDKDRALLAQAGGE